MGGAPKAPPWSGSGVKPRSMGRPEGSGKAPFGSGAGWKTLPVVKRRKRFEGGDVAPFRGLTIRPLTGDATGMAMPLAKMSKALRGVTAHILQSTIRRIFPANAGDNNNRRGPHYNAIFQNTPQKIMPGFSAGENAAAAKVKILLKASCINRQQNPLRKTLKR